MDGRVGTVRKRGDVCLMCWRIEGLQRERVAERGKGGGGHL